MTIQYRAPSTDELTEQMRVRRFISAFDLALNAEMARAELVDLREGAVATLAEPPHSTCHLPDGMLSVLVVGVLLMPLAMSPGLLVVKLDDGEEYIVSTRYVEVVDA